MRLLLKSFLLESLLMSLVPGVAAQSFQAAPILSTAHDPTDLVSANFRGDGKLDFAFIDGTNTVTVMLGNGNGTFKTGQSIPLQFGGLAAHASNILVGERQ